MSLPTCAWSTLRFAGPPGRRAAFVGPTGQAEAGDVRDLRLWSLCCIRLFRLKWIEDVGIDWHWDACPCSPYEKTHSKQILAIFFQRFARRRHVDPGSMVYFDSKAFLDPVNDSLASCHVPKVRHVEWLYGSLICTCGVAVFATALSIFGRWPLSDQRLLRSV